MGGNLHFAEFPILFAVPPDPGVSGSRSQLGLPTQERWDFFRQGDVPQGQRQEFVSRVPVMNKRRFMGIKKTERRLIVDKYGGGIVFEQQPIVTFRIAQGLLGLLAMSDVAKTPDTANDLRAHPLGAGMILEKPPVLEVQQSGHLRLGVI